MHIPDGFLSPPVWAALDAVTVPAIAVVARRANASHDERNVPLLGVLGAFVFAAQMINFPIAAGTSAHLLGSALLAYTLGPAAAIVVMTAVLVIQAFVFQDGGILALGANIFNLGVCGVLAAYLPYQILGGRLRSVAIFLGAALSVFVAGCLALAELMLSGVPIQQPVAMLSAGFFLVNAAAEGAITVTVIGALERMNKGWVRSPAPGRNSVLAVLAVCAVILAVAGFTIASTAPDSLESIAETVGVSGREFALLPAPMADYQLGGVRVEWVAKGAAGIAGLALVYLASVSLGRVLSRRSS